MKNIFNQKLVFIVALAGLLGACSPQINRTVSTGADTSSIIGGVPVKAGESIAQTTVALVGVATDENGKEGQFICTGSLLTDNVILTAGHCLPPNGGALYVVFTSDLTKLKREDVRAVDKVVLHPSYGTENDKGEDAYDIALVRYAGAKAAGYQVAKLLVDDSVLKKGTTVTLAGYGLTDGVNKKSDDRLRKVDVKVYENFGQTEMILDQSHGKGACHGDSGGPAFLSVDGVPFVWGVTSRGAGKDGVDDCSLLSVYTRVQAHDKFIQDGLAELAN